MSLSCGVIHKATPCSFSPLVSLWNNNILSNSNFTLFKFILCYFFANSHLYRTFICPHEQFILSMCVPLSLDPLQTKIAWAVENDGLQIFDKIKKSKWNSFISVYLRCICSDWKTHYIQSWWMKSTWNYSTIRLVKNVR